MPSAPAVHLAQVNVAGLRRPIDHPATADFVAGLVPVNAVADASPGFTEVPGRGDDAAGPLSVCFTRTVDPAVHREPSAAPVRTEP